TVTAKPASGASVVGQTVDRSVTLALPLPVKSGIGNRNVSAQGRLNAPSVKFGARGNIALRLPAQSYREAEVSLFSVNGRRIMRGKGDASQTVTVISRRNVAAGVYLLSVKGVNGGSFTTRLTHRGGGMNINVVFGAENAAQLRKAAAEGDWTITVSAEE